ncbi:hypothetical protein HII31_03226 [Pseudocercospora fuligena]|uniref:Uncharacterized protein n=1 Tax=Pseudocercospora fuligena TaxID=685502 RepID=A0A8H6RQH5_9PEZI|nr:hypothetical protein HII31_03226 [Pseudocercospora fuligena]
MSEAFAEKEGCLGVVANLQGGRYALSRTFHDLALVIRATQDYVRNHNHSAERTEPSTAGIFEDAWLHSISGHLTQAAAAPESNAMAMSLQSDLGKDFELHFSEAKNAGLALHDLFNSHRLRLEVVTSALKAQQDLSDEEVVRQIDTLRQKGKLSTKRDLEHTKRPYRWPEFRTEFGARKLNMSDSGNLVFDLSGFMSSVLGSDYAVPLRPDEFKAREERLEQESLEGARAKGEHPNVTLCRMCRNHTRPVVRKCGVAELTSRNSIMPHGNHHQLDTRLQCAICTLIRSVIMTSGRLLPRFAAMDREIQGTSLRTGYL